MLVLQILLVVFVIALPLVGTLIVRHLKQQNLIKQQQVEKRVVNELMDKAVKRRNLSMFDYWQEQLEDRYSAPKAEQSQPEQPATKTKPTLPRGRVIKRRGIDNGT